MARLPTSFRPVRRDALVAAILVLAGVGAAALVSLTIPSSFTATTTLFVSNSSASSLSDLADQGPTPIPSPRPDGEFSDQARISYADLATTPFVLEPVIRSLGLEMTAASLAQEVAANTPDNTALVEVAVTDRAPARAASIANGISSRMRSAVAQLSPGTGAGAATRLTAVRSAVVPSRPSSPNTPLMLALGGSVGLLVALAVAVVQSRRRRGAAE